MAIEEREILQHWRTEKDSWAQILCCVVNPRVWLHRPIRMWSLLKSRGVTTGNQYTLSHGLWTWCIFWCFSIPIQSASHLHHQISQNWNGMEIHAKLCNSSHFRGYLINTVRRLHALTAPQIPTSFRPLLHTNTYTHTLSFTQSQTYWCSYM